MIFVISLILTGIVVAIIAGPYAHKRDFEGDGCVYRTYLKRDDNVDS
jgi:hypothetical protein